MTLENIIEKVNEIMVDEFEVEASIINPESKLGEDLGLDSLDGVDLVVAVEKEFGCKIQEDVARNMKTIKDVYEHIEKFYAEK
ncbi:MAG: acyl carrier protein [Planctomycetes bacterium]|nr:acyl carrier protein [Planctomycetota bacterium]